MRYNPEMESILESFKTLKEGKEENTVSILSFLKQVYGTDTRKGLSKLAISHPYDVLEYSFIEKEEDPKKAVELFKLALMHDALEDSGLTDSDVKRLLNFSDSIMDSLKLLSRNYENPDGSEYIEGIFRKESKNESAIIVKMADRIANMKDLLNWIDNLGGFTKQSKGITEKYIKENSKILDMLDDIYADRKKASPIIIKQIASLKHTMRDLKDRKKRLSNVVIDEEMFDPEHGIGAGFDISEEDIYRTYRLILKIYNGSKELQEAYPDYTKRLDKAMKALSKKIEDNGFPYVKKLFDKVKFSEKDFIKAYEGYLQDQMLRAVEKLKSLKEPMPKEGLVIAIAKENKMPIDDVVEKAKSREKKDILWVFKQITSIMDKSFDSICDEFKGIAKKCKGTLIYRPSKYKNANRAYDKYIKDATKGEVNDFLDLGDIMGFRGSFDDLGGVVDFAIKIIEDTDYTVFKIKSFVGSGTAYQGVNLNLSYRDQFVFECQSVMDLVQVATDLNHDIFYKKIMKVTAEEKKAIAMMVQIFLGYMFDELFKFK